MPAPYAFLVALALAAGAWRARSLSPGGAVAAFVVGWLACMAGWTWAALLLAFFIGGSALSRLPLARAVDVEAIVAKGAARDAAQVFANGGVFAIAAVGWLSSANPAWPAIAAGALAAATADTFATEVGIRVGGAPRIPGSFRVVPRGTSGAVTAAGLLASAGGAALIALLAATFGLAPGLPILAAGIAGSLADTALGATVQEGRRCDACGADTERAQHACGAATRHARGLAWMDNDVVNAATTVVGGLVGWIGVG